MYKVAKVMFLINLLLASAANADDTTMSAAERQYELSKVRATENNEVANTICRAYNIATSPFGVALFGFLITVVGIGALQGKINLNTFIGLLIGIGIFFGAEQVMRVLGIDGGCKCKTEVVKGKNLKQLTGLNKDCTPTS